MPVITIFELTPGTEAGLWRIEEKPEELISMLHLSEEELQWIQGFQSGKRYRHWLGSRVLLRKLLRTDRFIAMNLQDKGQPRLINFPHRVSISHSGNMAAVMISLRYPVGIDVELIQEKILKIYPKFLTHSEIQYLGRQPDPVTATLAWSAKEVMFKAWGRGGVDFRKHLKVYLREPEESGTFRAKMNHPGLKEMFTIHYRLIEGYVLACAALGL